MRRILSTFLLIVILSFGFSSTTNASTWDLTNVPYSLPYVNSDVTFDKILAVKYDQYGVTMIWYYIGSGDYASMITKDLLYGSGDTVKRVPVSNSMKYLIVTCYSATECYTSSVYTTSILQRENASDNFISIGQNLYKSDSTLWLTSKSLVGTDIVNDCISYNYSDWGTCQENETQSRTLISGNPIGCNVSTSNLVLAQFCALATPQLTINIDPPAGGSVTDGGSITCASATCQYPMNPLFNPALSVTASTGYAFAGFTEKENPHPLTLNTSTDKTITAKFNKTFRNAATEGYRKLDGNTTGGQCLNYVESETDLPDDVCTYAAVNCMGQASAKGYVTGNVPKTGAIVIYAQTAGMNNGHAAIITNPDIGGGQMSLHDSNYYGNEVVHDRTVNINDANIMGYIYPTPQ